MGLTLLVMIVAASAVDFTGAQVLDLPPPPPPPGVAQGDEDTQVVTTPALDDAPDTIDVPPITEEAQQILDTLPTDVTALEARVETIEGKLQVVGLIPQFETRLNQVEQQATVASEVTGDVEALKSELDAAKVTLQNLQQRPYVEQPAFTGGIAAVESSIKKSSILSISLSVVTLLIVLAMVAFAINDRHKGRQEDLAHLSEYLSNYASQGYDLRSLRGHLLAAGWDEKLVDEAMQEQRY